MKRTQIYLNKDQELILKSLGRQRGRSVAELIREAIDLVYRRGMAAEEALAILERTSGVWGKAGPPGEEYVEEMRRPGGWNRRMEKLLEQS